MGAQEVLEENRFIAARDGMDARLIDVGTASQVPVREQLEELLAVCEPHADDLGRRACSRRICWVYQRAAVSEAGLSGLVASLASAFVEEGSGTPAPAATAGSPARGSR